MIIKRSFKYIFKKSPALVGFFSFFAIQFLFFYILQLLSRLIFILHRSTANAAAWAETSINGFQLDLSMVSYLLIPVLVVFSCAKFFNRPDFLIINMILANVIVFVTLTISFSDAELFHVWGTKNNSQSIGYLYNLKEAMASSEGAKWGFVIPLIIGLSIVFFVLYQSLNARIKNQINGRDWKGASLALICIVPCGIFIRGGLQTIPISQSSVYYSNEAVRNLAAVNSTWNFIYYVINGKEKIDTERYNFNVTDAEKWREYLNNTNDSFPALSSNRHPNVVVVVLESFSAYNSKFFKDSFNYTPFLDSLAKTGLAFTNAFSQGDRTDKGLACIFGGWPGQPWQSIINDPDKAAKLPSLAKGFAKHGYSNAFFYGGDLSFANMNAYLRNAGFTNLVDAESFSGIKNESKWGFHDEFVFQKFMEETNKQKQPFFNAILTLSSHEPFDVPGSSRMEFRNEFEKYRNSVRYTDNVLKGFMSKASSTAWFNNTIFVFVADHGRNIGLANMDYWQPAHFSIPIVFWGPALNPAWQRKRELGYCGQTDIGSTLLAGLFHDNPTGFTYGRNLLTQKGGIATYFFSDGFGILSPKGHVVWENQPPRITEKSSESALELLPIGKALQYHLIKEYKNF